MTNNDYFPIDPLAASPAAEDDSRRRMVQGVLESYNSNYDMLAEACQNAVDAVEDAYFDGQAGPFKVVVTINLQRNYIEIADTGIGMTSEQVAQCFAPFKSFKANPSLLSKRGTANPYRGYKGVGMTFLAFGTDEIVLHSKCADRCTKARMEYARAWVDADRAEQPRVVADTSASSIDDWPRGTVVRIQLSTNTKPRSLTHVSPRPGVWPVILRTRTAIGQIRFGEAGIVPLEAQCRVIDQNGSESIVDVPCEYLLPHVVTRTPAFRFLDTPAYYRDHPHTAEPPVEARRQDGVYMFWDTEDIKGALTHDQREAFGDHLARYGPRAYAFLSYQGSVWGEMNEILTGAKNRMHLRPGLHLAVNCQRIADVTEIAASRFETLSRNIMTIVHFDNARPDQGRKTLQDDVMQLAQAIADRAVQRLAEQRAFLKPAGDAPTPQQREVERNHEDWIFNVRQHAQGNPLHLPPLAMASTPLTEQDVVGLFHELVALGVFPGLQIYATSSSHTYDCMVKYSAKADSLGIRYNSPQENALGLSPYVLGDEEQFSSPSITLEFKNNLDALVEEVDGPGPKSFAHIHMCVCWSTIADRFQGYHLDEIGEANIDERAYPGVTHVLRRDRDAHRIQVIMLEQVLELLKSGYVEFVPPVG